VRAAADGPLYLNGRFVMQMPDGERIEETRVALCRCGASQNTPYCDNSHVEAGFQDSATGVPQRLAAGAIEETAVTVTFAPDGPVLIDGPVAVCGTDASEAVGIKCALCRCGKSQAKPFCDGSHAQAGARTA
jgi:CDGSH-type Zn-finger protein